jgi:hypothetical protein
MTPMARNKVLLQLRIHSGERDRWARAAASQNLRLGELVRLATRIYVREAESLSLLARDAAPRRPSSAA